MSTVAYFPFFEYNYLEVEMEFVGQSISVVHNGIKCTGILEEICLQRQEIRLKTASKGLLVLNAAEIEDLQVLDTPIVER